jgi:hypothetical protein
MERVLLDIEHANSYQAARYDGKLSGTHAGMILFYTDLAAKLWALDYHGLAPANKIEGFRTMATIKVPRQYWDDFVRLSKTRLWFGLRDENYDIVGNKLIFAPIATRVYAASSDPLYPGKETTPNYQSGQFLGWWDRHFEAVADYEPYYFRLNQLQKWGCLFTVLRAKNNRSLDFLLNVPVNRSEDFQLWYSSTADLISKAELPFVDKKKFKRDTECFAILASHGYPLMGQLYFISGGVSLASTKDILAKMNRHSGGGGAPGTGGMTKGSTKQGGHGTGGYSARTAAHAKAAVVKRTPGVVEASNKDGILSAHVAGSNIELSFKGTELLTMKDFVNSLVSAQEAKQEGYKDDSIFKKVGGVEKVVKVGTGRNYLVKLAAMKKWIQLDLNTKAKGVDYAYTNSGSEPDCDIFYSKAVAAPKTIQGSVIVP